MWWVEQYRGNESNERVDGLFEHVDAQSEARINAITTNMQLYGEALQKDLTSREGAITELFKNNEESSKLLSTLFPGRKRWDIDINNGKLPGMNENWNEQVIAKNDRFDKPFIRSTADIKVGDIKDIDTPHDVDNSNLIEQFDHA